MPIGDIQHGCYTDKWPIHLHKLFTITPTNQLNQPSRQYIIPIIPHNQMKTIKLHYRVKNHIYPFRVVVVIYDTQKVDPHQVQQQFLRTYSTLTLTQEESKLFNTFTTYQKHRFCIEHKKVLETRKDFVGETEEQRSQYFEVRLRGEEPKRATEYRKYLMEVDVREKERFFVRHFDLVLEKLGSVKVDIPQMIDCIHIIEIYVEEQSLINILEPSIGRVIATVLSKLDHQNLEIKRRGFKIISQLCSYYQTAYTHLFQQSTESSRQLDHIFKQVETQNLILIRVVLKFIIHLMYCATKISNFMFIVVECIETQLLHKLYVMRTKLKDRSFKIYESYDEYTNLNELESNSVGLRVEKLSVEKDTQFIELKEEIVGLIENIEKKFNELEEGRYKPRLEVNSQREELKKRYEKKEVEEYVDVVEVEEGEVEVKQHTRHPINPHAHKRARKRSTMENDVLRKPKYLDKMPPSSKQMTVEIVEGYQYKLLDLHNDYEAYRNQTEKAVQEKDREIERLNRVNRELGEKIKRLEEDMRKSRKKSCDMGQVDLFSKTHGGEELMRSVHFHLPDVEREEAPQEEIVNRVRNITRIFESTKQTHQGTTAFPSLPPPPPPPPSGTSSTLPTLPPLPPGLDHNSSLSPPPLLLPPPPLLSPTPKVNPNRKPKLQIKTAMKLISWSILQLPQIKGTFWQNMQDPDINIQDVEQTFGQGVISPTSKSIRKLPVLQAKASFLNSDRARMIQLILLKLKLNISTIKQTMYSLDPDILTYDTVMSLLSILPQEAEILLYKNKQIEYSRLSVSDQFYFKVCNIKGYEMKLRSLRFKDYFQEGISEYLEKLQYLKAFFRDLKTDKIFHMILKYSLSIGNIMNNNSASRQGAYGFKLDSLQKLSQITTSDNKETLLQYILRLIKKQQPHLLKRQLFHSYNNYQGVAVSSKVMVSDFADFMKNLGYVKRALTEVSEEEGDVSSQFFWRFYREAKEKLDGVEGELRETEEVLGECQRYYGDGSESERVMSSVIVLRGKVRKELLNQ